MNEQLIKIGLESGMLNYIDNETPRHYFLSGHADEQDLAKFAELIVRECLIICRRRADDDDDQFDLGRVHQAKEITHLIKKHFGVEQ